MITISTFALTIYLFGFLGSPNEPLIVAAAKTMYRKLTAKGHTMLPEIERVHERKEGE
jgi:hypothetical protein